MLPRTLRTSKTPRCCPASSRRRERGPAVVLKGARNLCWPSQSSPSSSIVASSSSSTTSAGSPRPSSPPLDPSIDARARHNAEQASTFNDAVEAFVETPAEVVPVSNSFDRPTSTPSSLSSFFFSFFFFSSHLFSSRLFSSQPPQLRNSASSASPRPLARRSPRLSGTSRIPSLTRRECSTSGLARGA